MKTDASQLDLIIGTMFSGKTSHLLSTMSKLAEINYSILYVNIEFDTRSDNIFSTHNPFFDTHIDFVKKETIKNNVTMIKSKNLLQLDTTKYDVIVIDEAHFFDDLVEFVNANLDKNKYVIVAGLMADFKGKKFGKILDLVPICSNIQRLHAYCSECAKEKKCSIATYSKKIVKCQKSVDIGGAEKYIPVCRNHYFVDLIQTNVKNTKTKNIIKEYEIDKLDKLDKLDKSEKTENIIKIENDDTDEKNA